MKYLYVILLAFMIWYKNLGKTLKNKYLSLIPTTYVLQIYKWMKKHTVIFHVDDPMSIHMEKKVNYNFD